MMKPNKFIMNSDYLSLAQTNRAEYTAYFLPDTVPAGQSYDKNVDFTVKSTPGAVDMFMISLNGSDYRLGSYLTVSVVQPFLEFRVYRLNATTIRVALHCYTSYSGGYNLPTQTVKVKMSSFKPPNVF